MIYTLIGLLILFFIGLLIWLLIVQLQLNGINRSGTVWNITYGSTTATSDLVPGGGANLFVAQSTASGYIAMIQPNNNSGTGQNLWIKNRSANIITISVSSGVSLDTGLLGNTVLSGQTAQLTYTSQDKLLRLT